MLIYHAVAIWIPALLGSVAFVQLRRTLEDNPRAAAVCAPLGDPIEVAPERSLAAGASRS